jgi:spoIIIJ-associated protein
MEATVAFAKKYLEDILSFFGLNTEIEASNDGEVIQLNVPSSDANGFLIGQRGETIRALQFIVMNALQNGDFATSRVNVDVAGYKAQRAEQLREKAAAWIETVRTSQKPVVLQPMSAADRRIVHQVASEQGIATESEGIGRDRHVILKPAAS